MFIVGQLPLPESSTVPHPSSLEEETSESPSTDTGVKSLVNIHTLPLNTEENLSHLLNDPTELETILHNDKFHTYRYKYSLFVRRIITYLQNEWCMIFLWIPEK